MFNLQIANRKKFSVPYFRFGVFDTLCIWTLLLMSPICHFWPPLSVNMVAETTSRHPVTYDQISLLLFWCCLTASCLLKQKMCYQSVSLWPHFCEASKSIFNPALYNPVTTRQVCTMVANTGRVRKHAGSLITYLLLINCKGAWPLQNSFTYQKQEWNRRKGLTACSPDLF